MNVNRLSEPGQGLTELGKYNDQLVEAGVMLAGDGLAARSEGKRVRFEGKQRTVVDRPSAETEELVASFWIWQVRSMDAECHRNALARPPSLSRRLITIPEGTNPLAVSPRKAEPGSRKSRYGECP